MNFIYHLSKWASENPRKSQLIITIGSLISAGLSYYYGIYLFANDIIVPDVLAWSFTFLAIVSIWFYPGKRIAKGKEFEDFRKRKSLDLLIYLIGVLLIAYLGNRRAHEIWNDKELAFSQTELQKSSIDQQLVHFVSSVEAESSAEPAFTFSRKEIKKQFKKQIREFRKIIRAEIKELKAKRKKGERSVGVNVLLTILTLLLMFALGILMVALACSVSCNGNGTLAAVILILGWGGIIVGGILAIRKIFQRDPNRPRPPKPKDNSYPY